MECRIIDRIALTPAWLTPWHDAKFANEDQNKRPIQQGTWDFATLQLIRQLHNIRQYMSYKM